jgi:hypothetical protein
MPCDKAIYRTHRTKPARKPANGAALRIMPLLGRMSSSEPEFRKRFLQLRPYWGRRHEGGATRGQPQSVYAKHSNPAGLIGAVLSVPGSWRLSPAARMSLGAASAESNKANQVQVEPRVRKEVTLWVLLMSDGRTPRPSTSISRITAPVYRSCSFTAPSPRHSLLCCTALTVQGPSAEFGRSDFCLNGRRCRDGLFGLQSPQRRDHSGRQADIDAGTGGESPVRSPES